MHSATASLLLVRRGLVFLPAPQVERASARELGAMLLEFAALGYAPSVRLRNALELRSTKQLTALREQGVAALAAALGAGVQHKPLFRRFPKGIPKDTTALWFQRVLVHYIQAPDQPCLLCDGEGTTHVLRPCEHVVCDRCFDGSNDSACPICNRHVDRDSPFFQPSDVREQPQETVRFKRLELGNDLDGVARALFVDFCARTQALNPSDKADFTTLLDDYGLDVLGWLPDEIPLRENVALIFGRLFLCSSAAQVLPVARRYLKTATDVLRLIATASGADAALQGATVYDYEDVRYDAQPWWAEWSKRAPKHWLNEYRDKTYRVAKPRQIKRFPMAKLSRATRRALLELLDGLDADALIEDMLRHRSYWVWVGEFLHPGEYEKRFPTVARAFRIVRKKDPQGVRAERFHGFYGSLELAAADRDALTMIELLRRRPGEFARRFDHVLRVAGDDEEIAAAVVDAFVELAPRYSTPVLLTLYGLLPTRTRRAKLRMFWPKGGVTKGVSTGDRRPQLSASVVATARRPIEAELLRRFAALPSFETAVVDDALRDIIAPFNERTASPSAVNLPRGSRVHVPRSKLVRMFLHWCQPDGGERTDIDLSVAFYDDNWAYVGVCSYYQLSFDHAGHEIAKSSGDLTSAPYPDGASEFVDLDRAAARAAGIRYAVMVVNAYAGMPFSLLERAFAGLMLRDDPGGYHFDPRTVALRFSLQGANGVYMPLCFDLADDTMHWLDVYSTGELAMNNVATSSAAITRICPEMITYFASGVRLDMRTLALLHAAARARRVIVRADELAQVYVRGEDESADAFLQRMLGESSDVQPLPELGDAPALALLHRGDLSVPAGSSVYALFREQLNPTLAAGDLVTD